jgi:hypothetical protein
MRGQCPQCREPIPWSRCALALLFWWQHWPCPRCGAWIEVRLSSQVIVIYAGLPAALAIALTWRWLGAYALSAACLLILLDGWLTSRLAIVTESSTHCVACGYPLPPLAGFAKEEKRLCPECGAAN